MKSYCGAHYSSVISRGPEIVETFLEPNSFCEYLCMSRAYVCSQFPCCPHLSRHLMMIMIMGSKVNHGARFKVLRPPLSLFAYGGN